MRKINKKQITENQKYMLTLAGTIRKILLMLLLFGIFIYSCSSAKQTTNETTNYNKKSDLSIEKDLKELSLKIDSLTTGKYGRSAFLDRGLDNSFELYDSLEVVFQQKFEDYLKLPMSLKNSELVIDKRINTVKKANKKIYQWEYISGGTQEEIIKYIQIIHKDSIEVYKDKSGYWTYFLDNFDNGFLEFESKKGCSTCCEERIIYREQEIYSIKYRNESIEQLFFFDKENQSIRINLNNIYIEKKNDDGYEILNKILILNYKENKFIEQK